MKKFIESTVCTSRLHCVQCRKREAGRKWREAMGRSLEMPLGAPDFECPFGIKWDQTPTSAPPKEPPPQHAGVDKLVHGATGLAKAATGIDRTPKPILEARQEICNGCEFKTLFLRGITTKCSKCGCILPAKQRIMSERCPIGKWDNISLPVIQ